MDLTISKIIAYFTICFLILGNRRAHALNCYDCNSNSDDNCKSAGDSTKIKTDCNYCVVMSQTLLGLEHGPDVTQRSCGKTGNTHAVCDTQEIQNSLRSSWCKCTSNLCNAAPVSHTRLEILVALLLASVAYALGAAHF